MGLFRSSQPSSHPIRDPIAIDDPTDNCCHNCMHLTVTLIHLFEFIFGLSLMGYSIAISTHSPDPQRGFAVWLELWSFLFIIASVLGTLGLTKEYCRRLPLTISSWIGPIQAVVTFVFFLIISIERESLLNYFTDKHEQLFLSMGIITFFDEHIALVYGFLFLLIAAEFARFSFLNSMKEDFKLHDRAKRSGLLRVPENNTATTDDADSNNWATNNRRGNDNTTISKSNITSPLIENNEDENDAFNNSRNSQWWEDDAEECQQSESMETIKHEKKKSWMSKLSWRSLSSSGKGNEVSNTSLNNSSIKNNNNNDDLFAPVDEEIDFQEPATEARTFAASLSQLENFETSSTALSWAEEENPKGTSNNDADLSWTKG